MGNQNKEKVLKAGIGYTVGNFLVKGLSFLTVPVFIRLMTQADFGDYITLMSYESIFSILIGFTIHTSFKNARYKYNEDFDKYISSIIILILISTGGFIIIANLLKAINVGFANVDLFSVNALMFYSASTAFIMCYNSYVAINYEYNSYIKVTLLNAIGNVILSVFFIVVVFRNNTYMGRLIGSVIPMILTSALIIRKLYTVRNMTVSEMKPYWSWGLKYSLPTVPHGLSQIVLSQFDRIMIRDMIGSEETAIYGFAFTVFLVVSVVTSSLTGVWDQWFYEQLNDNKADTIREAAKQFTIVFLRFCACYMLVSPEVVVIRGKPEYYASMYCVFPIVASGFFIFLYTFPAEIEYYYAKTKLIAICTSIAAAVNLVLNYILIGKYGYISAAYTTLVTYILYFILHYVVSLKIYGKQLYDLKTFIISGIIIVGFIPLCQVMIKMGLLRWLLAILIFAATVIYAQKAFNLFELIRVYILKRGVKQ
ncbi:MAG: oligosaccharide flippase family protein [Erysipelotrichaceae bacterium]|nr:oligosaccharide flippase family protein [Erysipelotrichaceae bacterium]